MALTAAMRAELTGFSRRLAALTTIVPNPVDVGRVRAEMAGSAPLRRAATELVASGRLVAQKNVAGLFDALAGVTSDWHLSLLGDGPERHSLADRARTLGIAGRVSFLGFTDRPAAIVGAADAFLMASLWEGMPNAALEALACGTPVIGPAGLPALRELAVAAPDGIRLFASPDEFARLIAGLPAAARGTPRPSLLPEAFALDNAVASFAAVAAAAMARRQGTTVAVLARPRSAGR